MKLMRLAMCVAVFALVGGIAVSEDLDVQALQARLAAQEARLSDLQAKVGSSTSAYGFAADTAGVPEGIMSLNKNAVVTIGGTINTRYFSRNAKVEWFDPDIGKVADRKYNYGDFVNADSNVYIDAQVNDNFEAYIQINLLDEAKGSLAQKAYVRWKNICNSGFGVLVGKGDLVFSGFNDGVITGWVGGGGGGIGDIDGAWAPVAGLGWDHSRTLQISPYWESQDGKYKIEASFFEGIDWYNGGGRYWKENGDRKTVNSGFGSASLKLSISPVEGLDMYASVMNVRNDAENHWWDAPNGGGMGAPGYWDSLGTHWGNNPLSVTAKNNTATNVAVRYRPCFLPALKVWGQWNHNWNAGWIDNRDNNVFNAGVSYDFTEAATLFVQGDYLRAKNNDFAWKQTAWAFYTGLQYRLPYGVNMEVGYRHESIKDKTNGFTTTEVKADIIYGHLGFDF